MTQDRLYAYRLADFGRDFPADPVAAVQAATRLTVTLTRAAEPVVMTLDGAALAHPLRLAGRDFAAGDPVRAIWTLVDHARALRLVGHVVGDPGAGGAALTVIACALPLRPGQAFQLSLPVGVAGGALPGGFAGGTRLLSEAGKRPVEDIAVGQKVWTESAGFQPVLWHGVQTLPARGLAAPVRLRRGLLGLTDDLLLAAAQGVKIDTPDGPVLIPAVALEATGQATRDFGALVTWHQLLLPGHAVIYAHGLPCESLWAQDMAWAARPADWPSGHVLPAAPIHPRLSVQDALRYLG